MSSISCVCAVKAVLCTAFEGFEMAHPQPTNLVSLSSCHGRAKSDWTCPKVPPHEEKKEREDINVYWFKCSLGMNPVFNAWTAFLAFSLNFPNFSLDSSSPYPNPNFSATSFKPSSSLAHCPSKCSRLHQEFEFWQSVDERELDPRTYFRR